MKKKLIIGGIILIVVIVAIIVIKKKKKATAKEYQEILDSAKAKSLPLGELTLEQFMNDVPELTSYQAKETINIINTGDNSKGEELAKQLGIVV